MFLRSVALAPVAAGTLGCAADDILGTSNAVRVAVSWSAAELQAFRSVLDGLPGARPSPGYRVDLVPLGDQIDAALSARGAGRPDVVMLPRPGLVSEQLDDLVPLPRDVWDPQAEPQPYAPIWHDLLVENGQPHGVPFKAAHKSLLWYRKDLFPEPPTFDDVRDGRRLALGAGDAWTLTDFFENILLSVSPDTYRRLQDPDRPRDWDTPEVRTSFDLLGLVWGSPDALAGGLDRSLALQFPDAVREVFAFRRAAMVVAPDFAEPFVDEAYSSPEERNAEVGVVSFPKLRDQDAVPLVAGGDVVVATNDRPQVMGLVRRLADPAAPRPWIEERGGFVPVHRSSRLRYAEGFSELVEPLRDGTAEFEFDLSDQIGGAGGWEGLWRVLRAFLTKVGDGNSDRRHAAADGAIAELHRVESAIRARSRR